MGKTNKTPEEARERQRQEELQNNPGGNMNDSSNRGGAGNLTDLAGGMSWKGTGILLLVLVLVLIIYVVFFR